MFAVVAVYPDGRRVLLGFVSKPHKADELVYAYIADFGEENLRAHGVKFNVELAF